jgi:hypothetical protein
VTDLRSVEVFRYDPTVRWLLVGFVAFVGVLVGVFAVVAPDDPVVVFFGVVGGLFALLAAGAFRCRITIDGGSLVRRGFVRTTTVVRGEIERAIVDGERGSSAETHVAIYRRGRRTPVQIDARMWDRTGDLIRAIRTLAPRPEDEPRRPDPPEWLQRFGPIRRAMAREEQRRAGG